MVYDFHNIGFFFLHPYAFSPASHNLKNPKTDLDHVFEKRHPVEVCLILFIFFIHLRQWWRSELRCRNIV